MKKKKETNTDKVVASKQKKKNPLAKGLRFLSI